MFFFLFILVHWLIAWCFSSNFRIPDNIYVDDLNVEHAQTINDEWPLKSAHSLNYIKSLILMNGGIGLFDANTDELLAWVITNENLIPG